ncbi:MAG: hypothetical protein R3E94_13565 [Burkholderiaceae bacterium]
MKTPLIALLLASSAGLVLAQSPAKDGAYATVKSVEGLVTVTSGNQLSNATLDMPLPKGAQIMSTTTGKATVVFANGCRATIEAGQSLLIEETACAAYLASNSGAGAGAASLSTGTKVAIGAAGLGVLYQATRGRGRGNGAVVVLPPEPGVPTVTPPATIPPNMTAPPFSGA